MNRTDQLKKNIDAVGEKIHSAALRSGRSADDIHVVCVTKYALIEDVAAAVNLGVKDLGENYFQEAKRKYDFLKQNLREEVFAGLRWHLIGHLQTNKVKKAVALFALIQTVDSLRLAQMISSQAQKTGIEQLEILIQVNISGEDTKSGVEPSAAVELAKEAAVLPNLKIKGYMGIGPLTDDPESARPGFRKLRRIYDETDKWLRNNSFPALSVLSMGMSGDYTIAIEEGSNMIRIGTAIFGG